MNKEAKKIVKKWLKEHQQKGNYVYFWKSLDNITLDGVFEIERLALSLLALNLKLNSK